MPYRVKRYIPLHHSSHKLHSPPRSASSLPPQLPRPGKARSRAVHGIIKWKKPLDIACCILYNLDMVNTNNTEATMTIYTNSKQVNGLWYWYEYKRSWGHTYRSFDGGNNWFRTSREAFQQAKDAKQLHRVGQVKITAEI